MFRSYLSILHAVLVAALLTPALSTASESDALATTTYRLPPAPITDIIDTPPTPRVSINSDRSVIAFLGREGSPPLERLAEPELRLAGTRINPQTNGPSRSTFYQTITFQRIADGSHTEAQLPPNARVSYVRWSPDGGKLAFANTTDDGLELWVADAASGQTRRLLGPGLNATLGRPYNWAPDGESLLVRRVPAGRGEPPAEPHVASGPNIQESTGQAAPARTYQDLLNNPHDEALFEHFFTSELVRIGLDGTAHEIPGGPAIIRSKSFSPNGEYILLYRVKRPYSYVAPLFTFPRELVVIDGSGQTVFTIDDRTEVTLPPIGRDMVNTGPRWGTWRNDAPATIVWLEAMDGGDARSDAAIRDRLYMLDAPFENEPEVFIDLDQRLSSLHWGRDDLALVHTRWRTDSRTKTYMADPSSPGSDPRLLWDRSYEDRYGDPGTPLTVRDEDGHLVLHFSPDGESIFLSGEGASERGDFPFLDRLNLNTGETERLWQAEDPYYETLVALVNEDASRFITRRESAEDPPNYFLRHSGETEARRLTNFPDPAPQLAGIQREIITYPREDGITLSATLFTPPGYDPEKDGPLPTLLWAYPREFRNPDAASQVRTSPNRFSRPAGSSPLFLLTQGYAVLGGPAMPIIGEGDDEPNDTYIEQLVASAQAAVDKIVDMGVAEPDRIAIAGHSYGAFMAVNLLAHSEIFRAGIARSGAFNRSLTPFGFQAEPRTYWEAQDTYLRMSPFNHADKVEAPLLLIHGEEDNNSGTFPLQSERMFQALRGHGAEARLVMLPHESHGYRARESILHVLAEKIDWLDAHLKGDLAPLPLPSETGEMEAEASD